jgi:hypothetical protein
LNSKQMPIAKRRKTKMQKNFAFFSAFCVI